MAFSPTTPAYCEATPTEWVPFLSSAVSSITRIASGPPHEPVGLSQEFGLERRLVPQADRHEVMQLVESAGATRSGHRLQALAVPRPDQASHIERTHAPACRVTKRFEEGFEPRLKFMLPRN